jgi:hypothetical protein
MGSYSCDNHLLPFLTQENVDRAEKINEAIGKALLEHTGENIRESFMVGS